MARLVLDRFGREYITWPITGVADTDALEVSIDSAAWVPMTRAPGTATALVAGPSATANPADTLRVPIGESRFRIRRTASPEIVIRTAATIIVT